MRWDLIIFTAIAFLGLCIPACVTRQEVQADLYLNSGIPAAVCAQYPAIQRYGMYRLVACSSKPTSAYCQHGEKQFRQTRPYCSPSATSYLSILNSDAEALLNKATTPTNN